MKKNLKITSGILIITLFILLLIDPFHWFAKNSQSNNNQIDFFDFSSKISLLGNGGFEIPAANQKTPKNWSLEQGSGVFTYINSSEYAHTGTYSIRLANCWNGDSWEDRIRLASIYYPLPYPEYKKYLLHGWTQSSGVEAGEILIKFKTFTESENMLTDDSYWVMNSTNWTQFNFLIETLPSNARRFQVNIQLDNSPGDVYFDDLMVFPINDTEYSQLSRLDKYETPILSNTKSKGTATGVTHLEKIDNIWWLVDPIGNSFWATGATSIGLDPIANPYHWGNLSSPNSSGRDEYRNNARVRAKIELGFNTNVKSTPTSTTENYIEWLNFGTEYNGIPAWILRDAEGNPYGESGKHIFPDPFDARWQNYTIEVANEIQQWFVDRPDTIGYWTDNEMIYGDLYKYIWSNASANIFIQWLQGNCNGMGWEGYDQPPHGPYSSIQALNNAWSSGNWVNYTYTSFNEILTSTTKPIIHHFNDTRVIEDLFAFERVIYKKYVDTIINSIRTRENQLGSNHKLIITNRFAYDGPGYATDALKRVMDIFSKFDIIGINAYPHNNRDRTYYSRIYLTEIENTFYKTTGKPIIIGEFGVAAEDANITIARWRPMTVSNQTERGIAYRNIITTLYSMPWSIGAFWFTWENLYFKSTNNPDPRNCGIVDDYDQFYPALKDAMFETNMNINNKGRIPVREIAWEKIQFNIITK